MATAVAFLYSRLKIFAAIRPPAIPVKLWSMTTARTNNPQAAILSAFAPIIPEIIRIIDTADVKGIIYRIFSIWCFNNWRRISPASIGISITFTIDLNIKNKDTSTHFPAKRYTSAGVRNGARRVETIVIPTDKGTSPSAIYVITLLAVPPGQHPTRITPSARSEFKLNIRAIIQADKGITVYWMIHPIAIYFGWNKIFLKSSAFIVIPIPNIAAPKKKAVCFVIHEKLSGIKKAVIENAIIIKLMYFKIKAFIFFKKFIENYTL